MHPIPISTYLKTTIAIVKCLHRTLLAKLESTTFLMLFTVLALIEYLSKYEGWCSVNGPKCRDTVRNGVETGPEQ